MRFSLYHACFSYPEQITSGDAPTATDVSMSLLLIAPTCIFQMPKIYVFLRQISVALFLQVEIRFAMA
jgi:hypothetical protein